VLHAQEHARQVDAQHPVPDLFEACHTTQPGASLRRLIHEVPGETVRKAS
jgi:hypothetical protein